MKKEGGLEAPLRHALAWHDEDFWDTECLDAELRRVFDICHGCRRCFNLCDSFPRLFDAIDQSPTGELDSVGSKEFDPVSEACTLCDMCFMTKCPYVPPHEFNVDFPHLMLRARAVARKEQKKRNHVLCGTDRNGKLGSCFAPLANWASNEKNRLTRPIMEYTLGVDRRARLPKFSNSSLARQLKKRARPVDSEAPGRGRKLIVFSTCFAQYNSCVTGLAAQAVLARNGVETEFVFPECCGMPQLEQGDLDSVAAKAARIARFLRPSIDKGYKISSLVPSCSLMLRSEWKLLLPDNEDVARLAESTCDITEYLVDLANEKGLAKGMTPLPQKIGLHLSCHSRAQNLGPKAAELLRLIPGQDMEIIERCSGHGGTWGFMKDNFETALKVGKPAMKRLDSQGKTEIVVSECPLAALHIGQGVESLRNASGQDGIYQRQNPKDKESSGKASPAGVESLGAAPGETAPAETALAETVSVETVVHPVILLARAYGEAF